MNRKNRVMHTAMTVLISAAMGVVASWLILGSNPQAAASTPAPVMYACNIVLSVVLGIVSAAVLPFGKWGRGLANKAHAKPPGLAFNLLHSIPLAVGNTAFISLVLSFVGAFMARRGAPAEMPPLLMMWLGSWAKLLAPTLCVSYLLSVLLSPVVAKIVGPGGPPERIKKGRES